jgi:double-GTPase-like protein
MNGFLVFVGAVIFGFILLAVSVALISLIAIWLAVRIAAEYFFVMAGIIDSELPSYVSADKSRVGRLLRVSRHVDQPRAFPHYFFGQVEVDAEKVIAGFEGGVRTVLEDRMAAANDILYSNSSYVVNIIGVSIRVGIVIGVCCGLVISAAIGIIHLIVAVACAVIAALVAVILRGADAIIRLAAGVRMVCPVCVRMVRPYAIYKCPSCGESHRDIRSGRRGISARICRCGQRMPALLLTGADRLVALCPRCMSPLPSRFGKRAEILIPFIGSVRAGKTQLIYTLVLALNALASNSGGTAEFLGESEEEIDRIGKRLSLTGSPGPTIPESPEALVLHLALGTRRRRRYIYLFDPAGELHYRDRGLDELRYLGKAHTLVYVADPLAAPGVWDRLSDKQKKELAPMRSDWAEAELSYEMSSEAVRRMDGKKRRMRLAFVVTKNDTLSDFPTLTDEESVRRFAEDWMDMGNVIRNAVNTFDKVKFFAAAATRDESGAPDASIERLAEWLTGVDSFWAGRR